MSIIQRPLARLFNKTADIYRLKQTGSTEKEDYQTHIEGVECNLQPFDSTFTEDFDGTFGKDYLMVCDDLDIKEQDKVVIDSESYRVVEAETFKQETHGHMELIIRKFLKK